MKNWQTGPSNYAQRKKREHDLQMINSALALRKTELKKSRGFADLMETGARTVGTVAGTIVGAVAGSVVPGVGTAAGAVYGAGVGNAAAGGAFDWANKSQEEFLGDTSLGSKFLGYKIRSGHLGGTANKYQDAAKDYDLGLVDANVKANTRHITKPIGAMARQMMLNKLMIGSEAAGGSTADSNAAFQDKFPKLLKNTKYPDGIDPRDAILQASTKPPSDISQIIAGGNPQASAEAALASGYVQGGNAAPSLASNMTGTTGGSGNGMLQMADGSWIGSGVTTPKELASSKINKDAIVNRVIEQNKQKAFVKDALDWNVKNKVVGGPDAFNAKAAAANLDTAAAKQVAKEEAYRLEHLAKLKERPHLNAQFGPGEHADDNYLKKRSLFAKWKDVFNEEKIRRTEMRADKFALKPRFKGSSQERKNAREAHANLKEVMGSFEDATNTVDSLGLQDQMVAVPVKDFKTDVSNTAVRSEFIPGKTDAVVNPGISLDTSTMDSGLAKSIQDSTLDSYNPATHQQYVQNLNSAPSIDGFMKKAGVGNVLDEGTVNGNWASTKGQYQVVFDKIMSKYFHGIPSNAHVLKEGRWKNILGSLHPDGQEVLSMIEKLEEAGEIVIPFK